MSDPVIEEYLASAVFDTDVTLTTAGGTQAGWWLLAVHSWDWETLEEMLPPDDGEDWLLVGDADAGENLPHHRVWAREVTTGGANAVTFRTGFEPANHARLYVLSGVRPYTPFRMRGSASSDTETSQVADQVYAPDDDALLICVWITSGGSTNYTLPATLTAQTELDVSSPDVSTSRSGYQALSAAGPTGTRTATVASARVWAAVQVVVSGAQGAITFPATNMTFRAEAAIGADLTAHSDDWTWTTITDSVFWRDGIRVVGGRADESREVEPGSCQFTLDNIIAGNQGGKFSPRNPLSPYFGLLRINTPIRIWIDPGAGFTEKFSGFVPSWPPRWTTGADRYVRITAKGLLYRLGQGTPPELSPFVRTSLSAHRKHGKLLAYWPGEDEVDSQSASSAVDGVKPMSVFGTVVFAASDPSAGLNETVGTTVTSGGAIRNGTKPLLSLADGGILTGVVPRGTSSPIAWTVQVATEQDATVAGETIILAEWRTPGGTYVKWRIQHTQPSGDTDVIAYTGAGAATTILSMPGQQSASFNVHRVTAVQDGADVDVALYVSGSSQDTATLTTNTLAYVQKGIFNPTGNSVSNDWFAGHFQVWDTVDTDEAPLLVGNRVDQYGLTVFTGAGHWREAAQVRLGRLCDEDSIQLATQPVENLSIVRMDSQPPGTQLDLYRASEATDGGILHEDGFGLGYLARAHRYSPPVSLALDYAQGHLWQSPEPVDDDQALRNQATVSRAFGGSGVAEDRDGPSGVNAVGPYESGRLSLNIWEAENLADRAAMQVAFGTPVEGYRYPMVSLNFARDGMTDLLAGWLDMPAQGGRMTIDNPPDDVPPETIDVIREGYVEYLDQRRYEAWANCSPTSPLLVWEVEGEDNDGRLESAGHVVAVDTQDSFTTLRVRRAVTTIKTIGTDTGYDLEVTPTGYIAGERMTVTAVADVTPSFVAAGAAAHAVNASVTPALPGHAAGDSLYVLAAIRNSGAGVPFTASTNWGRLEVFPEDSNVQLFGLTARSAAETDPTIQFTGGVANADTSAQAFRARGTTLDIIAAAAQLNASAADIAYPALTLPDSLRNRVSVFILYLGWKQDDWTSVATISGAAEIGEPDTTTGDDQGIVWDRLLQTAAANISAGSFVVTGGANAISRGAVVAFHVVEQNLTVTRGVNGVALDFTHGDPVRLWRPRGLAL